jgi:hypothetical protein
MEYLKLIENGEKNSPERLKIMIFTEGTILKPKNVFLHFNISTYIPIENAVDIIKSWNEQGAEIIYCTSSRKLKEVEAVKANLIKHKFKGTKLYYRSENQEYRDIVELVVPNILIEDDCRSIGGESQMCITHVKPEIKNKIKPISVEEFKGIENLSKKLSDML